MLRDLGGKVPEWEQQFRDAALLVGRQLFGPMLLKRIDQVDARFQPKPEQQSIGRRGKQPDGSAKTREVKLGAVFILDFYHACERLQELAVALDATKAKTRVGQWKRWLLKDGMTKIIQRDRQLQAQGAENPVAVEVQLGFLERHHPRMLYGTYRRHG